ncbi:MAG: hypothetical protein ACP5U0_09685, partial [Caldisphaera sp.]
TTNGSYFIWQDDIPGVSTGYITNVFHIPKYFNSLGLYLKYHANYNNILILPLDIAFSGAFLYNGTGEAANIDPLSNYFYGHILSNIGDNSMVENILEFPSQSITNFTNYLQILGVKYIILNTAAYPGPGAITRPFWNYPGAIPWNYTEFEYYLNRTPNLSYVKSFGPFLLYKVDNNVPLVYASNGLPGNFTPAQIFWLYASGKINSGNTSLIDDVDAPQINNVSNLNVNMQYNIISNDIYTGHVHAQTEYYLILDQGYANWNLYLNGSLYNAPHYLANGYANAWLMPKGNYTVTIINGYHQFYIDTFTLSILGFFILIVAVYIDNIVSLIRAFNSKHIKGE